VALDELVEVIEDLALAFGEGHHGGHMIRKQKAKVNTERKRDSGAWSEIPRRDVGGRLQSSELSSPRTIL